MLILNNSVIAQKKWIGGEGSSWAEHNNWYPYGVPLPVDDVIFDNSYRHGPYTVLLPGSPVVVHSMTIQPAEENIIELLLPVSNVSSPALTVSGSNDALVIKKGGIFKNSSGLNGGSSLQIDGKLCIYNGGTYIHNSRSSHATDIVSKLSSAPGTQKGIFEFDVPGGSYPVSLSNRTYGQFVLSSNASGGSQTYNASGSSVCTINGDMKLNPGVILNVDFTNDVVVHGDFIQRGGILNLASQPNKNILKIRGNLYQDISGVITETSSGSPAIEFFGTTNQQLACLGTLRNEVTVRINNPSGITLSTHLVVPFRLDLLVGIIKTSQAAMVVFQDNSTCSGARNSSYIDGPLSKIGNEDFEFPTGKQGDYAPVKISFVDTLVYSELMVEYHLGNPQAAFGTAFQNPPIIRVSALEYWTIFKNAGSVSARLTFTVGNYSHATALDKLVVARWDPGNPGWKSEGNVLSTGIATGLITSQAVNDFGVFTLASTVENQNPLPATRVKLNAIRSGKKVTLSWIAAGHYQQGHFEIEQSGDGTHFARISNVEASQSDLYTYDYAENLQEAFFVRIKLIQKNGLDVYSNTVLIANVNAGLETARVVPTHVVDDAMVMINSINRKEDVMICVSALNGIPVRITRVILEKGDNAVPLHAAALRSGMYVITITDKRGRGRSIRFVKL